MITVNNVVKEYNFGTDNKINALDGCSLVINDGEIVFVVGKSGSGKSTLLHIIGGLDKPTSGNVTYNEKEISSLSESALSLFRRDHIGYVFQEYNLLETLTIYENIALALTVKEIPKNKIKQTVLNLSERLDI